MKFKHVFALFLIFVLYTSCKQNQTYAPPDIIKPDTKDLVSSFGPTRMVRNVKQAKNGDILIASYTGVWRYDGKLFTNITTAIKSPSFWDVLEDRKGNLWFASKDSGVYCYPSDSLKTGGKYFLHYTTRQGLASNMALHIYEDRAGNIWFGSSRYDGKSFRNFTTKDGFPSNSIRLLLEDKTGKQWFGAQGESMFVYDGKTYTVLKNKDGKTFTNVWGITEDRKGNIWFGATIIEHKRGDTSFISEGIWRYDGSNYTKVSQKGAYGIIEDKNGNIWTTGSDKPQSIGQVWSLSRYDEKSLKNEKPTVTEIKPQSWMLLGILEDAKGNIWFGSGNGVYRWDGKTLTDFKPTNEQIYHVDQKESLITWKGSMKLSSNEKHIGTISLSKAELWVVNNQFVGGNFLIDMNSMEYGDKKDKNTPIQHLKSADYFDVKRFPFASIEITKVDSLSDKTFQITGYLTIKSVSHVVSFPATITIQNGILNATANLTIDRTVWGINYRSQKFYDQIVDQTVSDDIEFEIKIVAKK
jgi:polyisoprenoid-binding protein YceI/ligand-binding sensor domain-containing protein